MAGENLQKHHGRAMLLTGLLLIFAVLAIMWVKGQAERKPVPVTVITKSNWKKYGSDEDGDHYYKMDASGDSSPGIVRVWSQVVFNQEGKQRYIQKRQKVGFSIEVYDKLSHRNVLYEINCFSKKKEICIQEVFELTKEGKTIDYAKAGTYKDWTDIPPGSIYDKLYVIACPEKRE